MSDLVNLRFLRELRNARVRLAEWPGGDPVLILNQLTLASMLGISQSQVCRYEDNAQAISLSLLNRWVQILGYTLDEAIRLSKDQGVPPPMPSSLNIKIAGHIRKQLEDRIGALASHLRSVPDGLIEVSTAATHLDRLRRCSRQAQRRPLLALAGHFDAAKSRCANLLIGEDIAPMRYGPTTAVTTYIVHEDLRPTGEAQGAGLRRSAVRPRFRPGDARCPRTLGPDFPQRSLAG